ncbi:MAG: hypothetical protein E6J41_14315 [Chloroflexi bacterium]|nr:MAG: hypothetical protein E6J41_14315 [Chloroflexota bacterium]
MGTRRHNLPYHLTSLIGRWRDIAQLTQLVRRRRLLTLVGPPGCGKTRLAHEIGHRALSGFADGVWTIDLTAVTDEHGVYESIAHTLSIPESGVQSLRGRIDDHCRDRHLLLILDNCEHLTRHVSALASELLLACHSLHVLATSRERLGTPDERTWAVMPLAPPPAAADLHELLSCDSVRLWLDRVQSVQPQFELTPAISATVAALVRRLDGIPLALELAAAWSNVFSPRELLDRIGAGDHVLTKRRSPDSDRHRSLDRAIEWSCSQLRDDEMRTFAALGLCAGRCRMEAIAAISGVDPLTAADAVASMVDKSLLVGTVSERQATGYDMLLTVRQFAYAELCRRGELDEVRARFLAYYARLAEGSEAAVERGDEPAIEAIDIEYTNVTRALTIALEADHATAGRIATSLCRYWECRGRYEEGLRWLDAVSRLPDQDVRTRIRCLGWFAVLSLVLGSGRSECLRMVGEARALARQADDPMLEATVQQQAALISSRLGDLDAAKCAAQTAVRMARRAGDVRLLAHCTFRLARVALLRGETEDAQAGLECSLETARSGSFIPLVVWTLVMLGQLQLQRGQRGQARDHLMEALVYQSTMNPSQLTALIETMAAVEVAGARPERAATLVGGTDQLRATYAVAARSALARDTGELASLRRDPRLRKAVARGGGMDREALVRYLLGLPEGPASTHTNGARSELVGLTNRELQVAQLVAAGLTNRQIANRLSIAERTAEGHLERLRGKLGVHTRAEIASRVAVALAAQDGAGGHRKSGQP